jgi:hypothetical protein
MYAILWGTKTCNCAAITLNLRDTMIFYVDLLFCRKPGIVVVKVIGNRIIKVL